MKEIEDLIPKSASIQYDPFTAFWKTDTHNFFVLIGDMVQIWKFPHLHLQPMKKYYSSTKFEFELNEKSQIIQELTPIHYPENSVLKHDNPDHTDASWKTNTHSISLIISSRWAKFTITELEKRTTRRNINKLFQVHEKAQINKMIEKWS